MGKTILEITKNGFTLGGKPFYLASGDMHYFRHFKNGWRSRLELMKDFGLTAVQTYVPWNLHESEKGEFHFEDNLDIRAFLRLCDEIGLKVMFRPSPYMCSEWDFGGLPYWLLKGEKASIRTSDEKFLNHVKEYYQRLSEEFIPFLSTNEGPIIAVAVENEYGSYSDDTEYISFLAELLKNLGVDVPLYTTNGFDPVQFNFGKCADCLNGINLHRLTDEITDMYYRHETGKPLYIGEFWAGRSQQWGAYFNRQTPEEIAGAYKNMLEKNAYVNFYMFCGGPNFGFYNGANHTGLNYEKSDVPPRYIPFATSYDVDAPVTEYGFPTEKYFLCKKVLSNHKKKLGFSDNSASCCTPPEKKTQAIGKVYFDKSADLLLNADNLSACKIKSGMPMTFEELNQPYGFVLYSTFIKHTDDYIRTLEINGLHDRALIFGNNEYLGTQMRDLKSEPIKFTVPKEGLKLDILVENLGRINYGFKMQDDKKGITGSVVINSLDENQEPYPGNCILKSGWTNISLPLNNLDALDFSKKKRNGFPVFYEGEFKCKKGTDTFLDMAGFNKGSVWINGFNIGRYWEIGPQRTLYVPGELLEEHNKITVLELHPSDVQKSVEFKDAPILDTIKKNEKRL